MPKGLPIAYIKKWGISKEAWRQFRRGALTKGVPTRRFHRSRSPRVTRRGGSMVRRRRYTHNPGRRRGKSLSRSLMTLARSIALVGPAAYAITKPYGGQPRYIPIDIVKYYSGYNMETGKWCWSDLAKGWTPFLTVSAVTYAIPKVTGLIRRLG